MGGVGSGRKPEGRGKNKPRISNPPKIIKGKKVTPKQKGSWKTPSGVKAKSKFTKTENRIIKKYREKGTMKALTPRERDILLKASFK